MVKGLVAGNKIITFAMKSRELIRLLMRAGWYIVRQNGSHIIMRHLIEDKQIVVTMHGNKEMGRGLFKEILKQSGLMKGKDHEKN